VHGFGGAQCARLRRCKAVLRYRPNKAAASAGATARSRAAGDTGARLRRCTVRTATAVQGGTEVPAKQGRRFGGGDGTDARLRRCTVRTATAVLGGYRGTRHTVAQLRLGHTREHEGRVGCGAPRSARGRAHPTHPIGTYKRKATDLHSVARDSNRNGRDDRRDQQSRRLSR